MSTPRAEARRLAWITRLGTFVLRLLAMTWRIEVRGREHWDPVGAGAPAIYALWHGHMLPLLWHHRDRGVAILISEHRDGEIIARIAHALGFRTIRGSTTRGAGRALLGLIAELERGGQVAVTPDGPRGPAYEFAPGALVAAQRSATPILPVAAGARRAWRLRSWDSFLIPKPFARVVVAYAPLTHVQAPSIREAAGEAPRFQRLLDQAAALANA